MSSKRSRRKIWKLKQKCVSKVTGMWSGACLFIQSPLLPLQLIHSSSTTWVFHLVLKYPTLFPNSGSLVVFAVPTVWHVLPPDPRMVQSLTSFSSQLRCHPLRGLTLILSYPVSHPDSFLFSAFITHLLTFYKFACSFIYYLLISPGPIYTCWFHLPLSLVDPHCTVHTVSGTL